MKRFMIILILHLPNYGYAHDFEPQKFSDLPVRDIGNNSSQAHLAFTDLKCLAAANHVIIGFKKGQTAESLIIEAREAVRGKLPVSRLDRMIGTNIHTVLGQLKNGLEAKVAWQHAFEQCHQVVKEADTYDWCKIYPTLSRCSL